MLDVINQQGAQVEALKEKVRQQQIVITLLANEAEQVSNLCFDDEALEAAKNIEDVSWTQDEDGAITVHIRRFKPYNNGSKKK